MEKEHIIRKAIEEDIIKDNAAKKKIALYPFGYNGAIIKSILETYYGRYVELIVDNILSQYNKDIKSFDEVGCFEDYTWLITCEDSDLRRCFIDQLVSKGVRNEEVVDFWGRAFRFSIPYLDIVEKGLFLKQMIQQKSNYTPSEEVIQITRKLKDEGHNVTIAEIGVGYGITSLSVCMELGQDDTYIAFDFENTATQLLEDLHNVADVKCKLKKMTNSSKYWDSYSWNLSNMIYEMRNEGKDGIFDLVYLDGAHNFFVDGLACCLLKECLKPGGYIVFDDIHWSISHQKSGDKDAIMKFITEEQFEDFQILRVVNMFMTRDPNYERIYLSDCLTPNRAVFRKKFRELK